MNETRFNNEPDYPPQPEKAEVIMPKVSEPGILSKDLVVGHSDFEPYPHDTHKFPPLKQLPKEEVSEEDKEHLRKLIKEANEQQAKAKEEKFKRMEQEEQKKAQPKEAMRFVEGKLRFDLLPIEALIELTRVYDMGALKYDDDNWRKGMKWRQVYRPIFSHLFKWMSGQAVDSETGCHHLAMVAWNALTLLVYEIRKLGTDDRVKFAIDENFNWVDNHLGLGLPPEKIAELKEKYKQQREKAKC